MDCRQRRSLAGHVFRKDGLLAEQSISRTPRGWTPDAITILAVICLLVMMISAYAAAVGVSAIDPRTGERVFAKSLLSGPGIAQFLSEMPKTYAEFHPLGMVVIVMFGAGLAEKVGLFDAALSRAFKRLPALLLLPATCIFGICAHIGVDASYFVFIPLAGLAFKAAGRDPFVGVCVAFAAVAGGYGANLLLTPTDAVTYGLTQVSARTVDPDISINIAANYYLLAAFAVVVTIVVTLVTVLFVEPAFKGGSIVTEDPAPKDARLEGRGLLWAAIVMLIVIAAALALALPEDAPLRDPVLGLKPFFDALIAIMFWCFFLGGLAYGVVVGTIKSDADVARMLRETVSDLAPFFVLVLVAAHFASFLKWSNLATILAVNGGDWLRSVGIVGLPLVLLFATITGLLDIVMPSASGKWAILAPTAVPMLMNAGLSPEFITAIYRIGDSAINIITPTSLLPVVLIYAQKYRPDIGLFGLIRIMIPYALGLYIGGLLLLSLWYVAELPLGPTGASFHYTVAGDAPK